MCSGSPQAQGQPSSWPQHCSLCPGGALGLLQGGQGRSSRDPCGAARGCPRTPEHQEHTPSNSEQRAPEASWHKRCRWVGPRGGAWHHSVLTEPRVSRGVTRRVLGTDLEQTLPQQPGTCKSHKEQCECAPHTRRYFFPSKITPLKTYLLCAI